MGSDDRSWDNRPLPRWSAPLVGVATIGALAAGEASRDGQFDARTALGILGVGFLCGVTVALVDDPLAAATARTPIGPGIYPKAAGVLARVATVAMCVPFVNLPVTLLAFILNRRAPNWANRSSRLSLGVSLAVTAVVTAAFLVELKR